MAYWIYQMSAKYWLPERYRTDVWEGNDTIWDVNKISPTGDPPRPGDILVLFYAKAGVAVADRGIYGWAIIMWHEDGEVRFRPTPPSDYLKMNPLWNDEINYIINQIRGRMPRGTMWKVDDNLMERLREKIAQHVYGKHLSP